MKQLSITRRFDAEWNEVEKPEYNVANLSEQEAVERGKDISRFERATERSVLVGTTEYIRHRFGRTSGYNPLLQLSCLDAIADMTIHIDALESDPLLSEFIPAIKEGGKWKVLKSPDADDFFDGVADYKESCEQFQKAQDAVKYEGWIRNAVFDDYIDVFVVGRASVFFDRLTGKCFKINLLDREYFTTTESLITELAKHKQFLILK